MSIYVCTPRDESFVIRSKGIVSVFSMLLCSLVLLPSAAEAKTLIFESNEQRSSSTSEAGSVTANRSNEVASAPAARSTASAPAPNQQALSEMYFLVEQLKREVLELRGVIEEQSFRIKNLEESGKRRYKDLDQRVLSLTKKVSQVGVGGVPAGSAVTSTNGSTTISTSALKPESQPVDLNKQTPQVSAIVPVQVSQKVISVEERQAYDSAYAFVKDKKFEEAIDALHEFVEKYPESDLAGNAYYWLGEVYLVLPQLEQAKQSFLIVLQSFPQHRKLPDSIFKLAVTYDRLLDPNNSEKYLKMVQQRFPKSTASKLASNYKIAR